MTVWEDKPVFIAQAILDNSKIIMTNYYYNDIKQLYGDKATMLYGDTDSAYLEVYTDDIFADLKPYVEEWYDTSVYEPMRAGDPEHPAVRVQFSCWIKQKKTWINGR